MCCVADAFRYFADLVVGEGGGRVVDAGSADIHSVVVHEPVGVCALITPWNYPLLQAGWKIAPALAAGNTFVIKPSEITPLTTVALIRLLAEAGLSAGVANLVTGPGHTVGARLAEHPDVDLVSFTGGLVSGTKVARAAAESVKKVALELGGKNPNVVFADACATDEDFDTAVDQALNAAFIHSGQVCSAGSRLIVEETVRERFVAELVRRAGRIRLGRGTEDGVECGPLVPEGQREKTEAYVASALAEGAVLRAGGRRPEPSAERPATGYFYEPTVLDQCHRGMRVVREEVFGPHPAPLDGPARQRTGLRLPDHRAAARQLAHPAQPRPRPRRLFVPQHADRVQAAAVRLGRVGGGGRQGLGRGADGGVLRAAPQPHRPGRREGP